MTISDFARAIAPAYKREQWKWYFAKDRYRVPNELEIAKLLKRLMLHSPRPGRIGQHVRSGGLLVERISATEFKICKRASKQGWNLQKSTRVSLQMDRRRA